jgi:hypothetical protein
LKYLQHLGREVRWGIHTTDSIIPEDGLVRQENSVK